MFKHGRELKGKKKDRFLKDAITIKTQGEREKLLQKL